MSLQEAFVAFASFGASSEQKEMDNSHFSKMCKECGLVDKHFTTTDVDMIFTKIKAKGARKISFGQFEDGAIAEIAAKKKVEKEAVAKAIMSSSPQSHGTKADAVKFHDDKSTYTGVYKAGGPTNVDRDPASLSGIVDRRVDNDVRGATKTQK